MCELGITKEKVREHAHWKLTYAFSSATQVLYHGNLLTKRDMTDVSDSSRVMVDLIEVSALFY
jgi:hypothetical protein